MKAPSAWLEVSEGSTVPIPSHVALRDLPATAVVATPRDFRTDIQGLRAVAVLLVVLFHANVPGLRGGFIGVDVFFVISGFVITDLLLRERHRTQRISLRRFYARRARRILPAGTLVIIVTLLASYHWLGFIRGGEIAQDARWTSVLLANVHFALEGNSYFGAQAPPSSLEHFWSLAVEEQFYLVWPTIVLISTLVFRGANFTTKLTVTLCLITAGSLIWSVVQTGSNATWAYYSPLARACELSSGALLVVGLPLLRRIPRPWAAAMSWLGLAGIIVVAFWFDSSTPFPGFAVTLPIAATCLAIAGGTSAGQLGASRLIGRQPWQFFGLISYSLYLWHWPMLTIPAEYLGHELSLGTNLLLAAGAVVAASITYLLIEGPIRFSTKLSARPRVSLALGLSLAASSFAVATYLVDTHPLVP